MTTTMQQQHWTTMMPPTRHYYYYYYYLSWPAVVAAICIQAAAASFSRDCILHDLLEDSSPAYSGICKYMWINKYVIYKRHAAVSIALK